MKRSLLICWVLLFAACSSDPIEVFVSSFERPGDLAFVCFDATGSPVTLDRCGADNDDTSLHALVTQTSRGEVAAVDLRSNRIIDSDKRVPGSTFLPVGELPSAIVVPANNPAFAYVADLGSGDIVAVPTTSFLGDGRPGELARVELPAGATDLALSPDETSLFAAVPDAGDLIRIPLSPDGTMGAPEVLALGVDVPTAVDASPRPDYCRACYPLKTNGCPTFLSAFPTDATGTRLPYPAREPVSLGATARPVALTIDADAGELLIADEALPIVHRVGLDDFLERPGIATGVPTTALALTPAVPEVVEESTMTARFLYAVDAIDRTVLVVDYVEGSVMPISVTPGGPPDRLDLGAAARTLTMMTPGYPAPEATSCDSEEGPLSLRGVFVAVGAENGIVTIVDIHDLDAVCRGGGVDPAATGDSMNGCHDTPNDDRLFAIYRHRPRIAERLSANALDITTPGIIEENVEIEVIPYTGEIPSFAVLETIECAAGQTVVFGGRVNEVITEPQLCVLSDPWASRVEPWTATWEGALPGTAGGRGRLRRRDGAPTLEGEVAFCARGVLGNVDAAGSPVPEGRSGGDMLVITAEPPPSVDGDDECQQIAFNDFGQLAPLELPIVTAHADHLELAPATRTGVPFDTLARCYPELFGYEVRAQEALTVVGGATGFLHRIAPDIDGACRVDDTLPATQNGRAAFGQLYDNGQVRFTLAAGLRDEAVPEAERRVQLGDVFQFLFAITGRPTTLFVSVGTLPRSVRYSSVDERLYAVDTGSEGLLQLNLSPVEIARTFE